MANKSQGTWFVSFELPTRTAATARRATQTFPNEEEAKKFARAKLAETPHVSASTINPHLPKRTIASDANCSNGSKNWIKTIWLEQVRTSECCRRSTGTGRKSSTPRAIRPLAKAKTQEGPMTGGANRLPRHLARHPCIRPTARWRLKALLGTLACGYFKLLTVIVSDPHIVLVDPTILDFANASCCHASI